MILARAIFAAILLLWGWWSIASANFFLQGSSATISFSPASPSVADNATTGTAITTASVSPPVNPASYFGYSSPNNNGGGVCGPARGGNIAAGRNLTGADDGTKNCTVTVLPTVARLAGSSQCAANNAGAGASASCSLTVANVGDMIIVPISVCGNTGCNGSIAAIAAAATLGGNACTLIPSANDIGSANFTLIALFQCTAASSGAQSVVVTLTGGTPFYLNIINAQELAGVAASSPIEGANFSYATGVSSPQSLSTSASVGAGDFVYSVFNCISGTCAPVAQQAAAGASGTHQGDEYQIASAAGTFSNSWTYTGSDTVTQAIVAIKPASTSVLATANLAITVTAPPPGVISSLTFPSSAAFTPNGANNVVVTNSSVGVTTTNGSSPTMTLVADTSNGGVNGSGDDSNSFSIGGGYPSYSLTATPAGGTVQPGQYHICAKATGNYTNSGLTACGTVQSSGPGGAGWQLAFGDEFNDPNGMLERLSTVSASAYTWANSFCSGLSSPSATGCGTLTVASLPNGITSANCTGTKIGACDVSIIGATNGGSGGNAAVNGTFLVAAVSGSGPYTIQTYMPYSGINATMGGMPVVGSGPWTIALTTSNGTTGLPLLASNDNSGEADSWDPHACTVSGGILAINIRNTNLYTPPASMQIPGFSPTASMCHIQTWNGSAGFSQGPEVYTEVNAQMPLGTGHSSIWLLTSSNGWPPEIDFPDYYGSTFANYFFAGGGPYSVGISGSNSSFIRYATDVTSGTITWYENGGQVATTSLIAGDSARSWYPLVDSAKDTSGDFTYPTTMQVDYVRVYKKVASNACYSSISSAATVPHTGACAAPTIATVALYPPGGCTGTAFSSSNPVVVPDNTTSGTALAQTCVTMSDGSAYDGAVTAGTQSPSNIVAISGANVNLGSATLSDTTGCPGTLANCDSAVITAAPGAGEGGSNVSATLYINVTPANPASSLLTADRNAYGNWKMAGLQSLGGIPTRTNVCATVSPIGGGADDTTNINNAINGCGTCPTYVSSAACVVKLAAGVFTLSGSGPINLNKSAVLRGVGPGPGTDGVSTLITRTNGAILNSYQGFSYITNVKLGGGYSISNTTNLASDGVQGASTVSVTSATGISVGSLVVVDELANGQAMPECCVGAASQTVQVWAEADYRVWWNAHSPTSSIDSAACVYGTNNFNCGSTDPTAYSIRAGGLNEEYHRVSAVNGTTITFDSPLTMSYRTANTAQLHVFSGVVQFAGIENLSMQLGSDGNMQFQGCMYCWGKTFESYHYYNPGIHFIQGAFRDQIENFWAHNGAWPVNTGGGYSIGLTYGPSEIYIVNGISEKANKVIVVRASGAGSVAAYNYMDDGYISGQSGWVETGLNCSHLGGSHHMLFEGNQSFNVDSDFTHGASPYCTYFRNYITGIRATFTGEFDGVVRNDAAGCCGPLRALASHPFTYWTSFVGNVAGTSGVTTSANGWVYSNNGSAGGSAGTQSMLKLGWDDFNTSPQSTKDDVANTIYPTDPRTLGTTGTYSSANGCMAGATADPNGNVGPCTTIVDGNYDYVTNSVTWASNDSAHTLPSSFYLTSKPGFFTGASSTWPPIDPLGTTKVSNIPAHARWAACGISGTGGTPSNAACVLGAQP